MHLSPVVRRMRDDPLPEESVTLVVRVNDAGTRDTVRELARDGEATTLEGTTQLDNVRVSLPETAVDDFCAALPDAVEAVETAAVTGFEGDAGEDVGSTE